MTGTSFAISFAFFMAGIVFIFGSLCDCASDKRGWKTLIGRGRRKGEKVPPYLFRFWVGIVFVAGSAYQICTLG